MSLAIRYAGLDAASTVDGPGVRTVVWLQGCSIQCEACQNRRLWDKWGGRAADPLRLATEMVQWNKDAGGSNRYTITGGEPFDQVEELLMLVNALRVMAPNANILVYTGYTWQALTSKTKIGWRLRRLAIMQIDTLVDGPYRPEQDSEHMQYIGSGNQRIIAARDTARLHGGLDGIWPQDDLVILDWSSEGMLSIVDGKLTMAKGWLKDTGLADIGTEQDTPRCGQSERMVGNGRNGNTA